MSIRPTAAQTEPAKVSLAASRLPACLMAVFSLLLDRFRSTQGAVLSAGPASPSPDISTPATPATAPPPRESARGLPPPSPSRPPPTALVSLTPSRPPAAAPSHAFEDEQAEVPLQW